MGDSLRKQPPPVETTTPRRYNERHELAKIYTSLSSQEIERYVDLGLQSELTKLNEMTKRKKDETLGMWTLTRHAPPTQGQVINLVLLGKTGAGKSATGNLIIGDTLFEESASSQSCTRHIERGECMVERVKINIIDTPGFDDTKLEPEVVFTEISKVVEEFSDGIDGMLFVFNMGNTRFTKDQEAAFNAMEKGLFGDSIINNCFVILTNIESKTQITSLSQFLEEEGEGSSFRKLLTEKLSSRVIGVNNAEQSIYGREVQRQNIVRLIAARRGQRFTSEMFESYKMGQLKLTGQLPEHIQFLATALKEAVDAELRPLPHKEMKGLQTNDSRQRTLVQSLLEKMMMQTGVQQDWIGDVRRAIQMTLEDVINRLMSKANWKKIGLTVVLFTVTAGTAVGSILAPQFSIFIVAAGATAISLINNERKKLL